MSARIPPFPLFDAPSLDVSAWSSPAPRRPFAGAGRTSEFCFDGGIEWRGEPLLS